MTTRSGAASLFSEDFKTDPYWWEASPRPRLPETPLPSHVDVLVVGSGYTGLNAALVTARDGRSTLVLEKGRVGEGCSTRNGGQISTSVKPSFAELSRRHGPDTARAILMDGREALRWIGEFTRSEGIDCDFAVRGRFHAAHSAKAFEAMRRDAAKQAPGLEVEMEIVPRAEQHREIGTDAYYGGIVLPRHAVLDPGRYHAGLLARVREAGATIAEQCPAIAIERDGTGFIVTTPRGRISAREVVIATNGYTGAVTPWLRRRVIPIGSYIIATEPMPRETMRTVIPQNRIVSDSRKVVYYYRLSPDGTRMIFGGRVSHAETDPRISGPLLHGEMARLFPQLAKVRISHSWMGFVAYTFDTLAHTGSRDGMHYAMGYCGSGVSMASYLGMRTGQKVLGLKDGITGFDAARFQTRPLYTGRPWFLAASVRYYRWKDSRN
jgi:glycine/D-amino acid oxidase-like deaminating enzyme